MVQSSCSGSVQWAFGTIRSHPDRPGKMLTLRDSSARSAAAQRSAFDIVLNKKLTVAHGAGEITAEEAIQQGILRDALAGRRSAMRDVVKWIVKREAWRA